MKLFKSYKDYLQERFPWEKTIRKISLDGGFSCPNMDGTKGVGGCTFCNNRSFSPSVQQAAGEVQKQLTQGKYWVSKRFPQAKFLAYYQPYSNTYAPIEQLSDIYKIALEDDEVIGFAIGTRPDCLGADVKALLTDLASVKPVILEIGLQTATDSTLDYINRGHTVDEWHRAVDEYSNISGLDVTTHVILGLPNEGPNEFSKTSAAVAAHDLKAVKIHPLHIVKATKMAKQYLDNEFKLLSYEAYIDAVVDFICRTPVSCAIERFTGEAPADLHLGPDWSGDRIQITNSVEKLMRENGLVQGCLI